MTKEDIIFMAREAGAEVFPHALVFSHGDTERFAALVAAHEREEFKAELVEKVASNTWSFQPTKWVGLDEYTKNRFQDRIKEESMTSLEIMDLVEHFLKVSNGGLE